MDILLKNRLNYLFRRNIFSEIDHIKTVIFQQDFYDILSDIVDISLDCRKDDLSFFLLYFPALIHSFFEYCKCTLCRLCTHQKLWKEYSSFFKSLTYIVQSRDQFFINDIQCIFLLCQFCRDRTGFFFQSSLDRTLQCHRMLSACCLYRSRSRLLCIPCNIFLTVTVQSHQGMKCIPCFHHIL